jgi:formylmethanofuran dehydrogenase subunit D
MQKKKMKVQYSTRARQSKSHYFGSDYIETPKIQMEGKWLEALGFQIGDAIQVAYEEGSIHISLAPQTQSEPAMVCNIESGYASK